MTAATNNNGPSTGQSTAQGERRRGRRPADATARRVAVEAALRELTDARVPFSMSDLAERVGISRATLYRDAGLRDLVGRTGDGPAARPVNRKDHDALAARVQTLASERRALRRQLREAEKRMREAETRADALAEISREQTREAARQARGAGGAADAEKIRTEAFAEGFTAGTRASQQRGGAAGRGGAGGDLLSVAARLPRPAIVAARKTLARALHPDLYAQDPAAALLATELMKQINALAGSPSG